jgi:hypothetical protein
MVLRGCSRYGAVGDSPARQSPEQPLSHAVVSDPWLLLIWLATTFSSQIDMNKRPCLAVGGVSPQAPVVEAQEDAATGTTVHPTIG